VWLAVHIINRRGDVKPFAHEATVWRTKSVMAISPWSTASDASVPPWPGCPFQLGPLQWLG
jgi:hypothetical protein